MRQRKEQPTIESARRAYWEAIEHWDYIRREPDSTWWQLRDAAQDVENRKADWEAACFHATPSFLPRQQRRYEARLMIVEETSRLKRPGVTGD